MTSDRGKGIFIGWAVKDITPDRPVNLYGQFHQRISERVHDPVTITTLAMSTEQDHAVMVSCDICTINSDILERCRDAIGRKTPGLDVSKVILNATHTHTAPSIREGVYPPEPEGVMTASEYAGFFIRAVAEAVDMAWKRRKKGGVSWAYGHAVVGHNRRTSYFDTPGRRQGGERSSGRIIDGSSIMYGRTDDPDFSHMEGYEDHGVEILFTWDAKKRLTGMIINLACPSQETEMATYISADFWHDIREEVRKRCGRKLFILPQCSAAGDQSPHLLLYRKAEERMLKLRGMTMRQEIGRRVAGTVEDVLPYAGKEIHGNPPLSHTVKTVQLKKRLVTDEEVEIVRKDLEDLEKWVPANDGEKSTRFMSMNRCRKVLEKYAEQKDRPLSEEEIHIIRLGDVAFATNRFELFLDYGLRIKARSPFLQTFIVQLAAGGRDTGTYLPTEKAVAGKGYSANIYDNEVGPEGGRKLVEETVRALAELMGGDRGR